MVPERISLITIGAYHLPELREFYRKLGWTETETSSDGLAVFRTAGVLLSLYPMEELLKDSGMEPAQASHSFKGVTFAINTDTREQVDSVIREVKEIGGRVTREPFDAFWGGRVAYFFDPEYNAWEVAWNPTAVFDDRGAMISF
jgi:predicted lactoylglutathione lyase